MFPPIRGIALALALALTSPAAALPLADFEFTLEVDGVVEVSSLADLHVISSTNPSTGIQDIDLVSREYGSGFTLLIWRPSLDEGPFLTRSLQILNTTATAKNFVITTGLPINPFTYEEVINTQAKARGFDSNDDFAVSVTSDAFFNGIVNGTDIITLLAPLNLTILEKADEVIVLQQDISPRGLATEIGFRFEFTAAPFDTTHVEARFELLPEPGPLLLLALGGLTWVVRNAGGARETRAA